MTRARWVLLAILLLGTALRFYRVAEIPLRADEATSLFLAREAPQAIVNVFITSDPHMPLYFLILHYWILVAGISELATCFPAVFVGSLSVALTYALARQLFPHRRNIALIGAALIAINPFLIWDSQDIYMYSVLTAATLASFNLFLRAVRLTDRWQYWLAYIVASTLGLYLHYFFAFILLAQGTIVFYWILARRIHRRTIGYYLVAQITIALLFLPWLIIALPLLATFHSNFIPPASLFELLQRALVTFTIGRTDTRMAPAWVDPTIGTLLSLGFLVVFLYGALTQNQAERAGIIVLAFFLGVPLGAFFLYSLVRFPLFDERYILYISAAFSLILARGLVNLLESSARRWLGIVACVFFLFADGYALNNYFHVPEYARSPDWHTFMRILDRQSQPGDVVIQNYPDPALPYYLRERVPRVLLPRSNVATMAEVNTDLQRLTNKYARAWFQAVPYSTWDTEGWVATWLQRHARLIAEYKPRGLDLQLYLSAPRAIEQATPVDAIFAGQIRLCAFDFDVRASDLRITLYWQAITQPMHSATVFVHLCDTEGNLVTQQDNTPVNGTYPTIEWSTENFIVDEYLLQFPADMHAGKYFVAVGLYDPQTHTRWSVRDARGNALPENRVRLLEVLR